ncbi:hypothetical protein ABFS83_02G042500 [Erythranthe nasuta]
MRFSSELEHSSSAILSLAKLSGILTKSTPTSFAEANSSLNECFSFFKRMKRGLDVVPDKYTFPSVIKACSNVSALEEGRVLHGVTVSHDGWVPEFGDMAAAKSLFDEMPKRNTATWNAMIKGLVKSGDLNSARNLFDEMPVRNEGSFTTLIDGYAKGGDMAAARSLFDQLTHKDLFSWSALMSGYVQNGKACEAVKAFSEMQDSNLKPDEFIMVNLMSACSQLGCSELAKWIESYMKNGSFDLRRAHVAAALVDMNAKCGNMDRASSLFEEMPERDLISYCSTIQGLCIHGFGSQAVHLFDRMINEGIRPDDVAFTVILSACTHAGLVDDGCRFFELMVNGYLINPTPDHYSCMVNLLGKSGKVEAAYELIRSMPVESHAGAWGALLEACRVNCDVDLGEVVASRLFELEPHNAGNYVLLSNIYAEADRWSNVFNVRDKMSKSGVRKVPGCTYVESTMAA